MTAPATDSPAQLPEIPADVARTALGCLRIHELKPGEVWQMLSVPTRRLWLAMAHCDRDENSVKPWGHLPARAQKHLARHMRAIMALLAGISADVGV